jgi:hypothetical protein
LHGRRSNPRQARCGTDERSRPFLGNARCSKGCEWMRRSHRSLGMSKGCQGWLGQNAPPRGHIVAPISPGLRPPHRQPEDRSQDVPKPKFGPLFILPISSA